MMEKYHVLWSTTAIYVMELIGSNYHHEMHFLLSDNFAHAKKQTTIQRGSNISEI